MDVWGCVDVRTSQGLLVYSRGSALVFIYRRYATHLGAERITVTREQPVEEMIEPDEFREPAAHCFAQMGVVETHNLARFVQHRNDRVHVSFQLLFGDELQGGINEQTNRRLHSFLEVFVPKLLHGKQDAFSAVDLSWRQHRWYCG